MLTWQHLHSKEDLLGSPFIAHTFAFQGVATQVVTTLVEYETHTPKKRAILYLHGYTDYFFQADLAQHFTEQEWQFYALDLQGYGRSIRPNSRPNWCENMAQYHDDLRIALCELKQRGIEEVVLLAHSTGGLIASHFLAHLARNSAAYSTHEMAKVTGLILNSPFLALPFSPEVTKRVSWPIWLTVSLLPFHSIREKDISLYARTLHKHFCGEWEYRLDWKPAKGFPLSFNWLKQILLAQKQVKQLGLALPTLMCCSSATTRHERDPERIKQGDGVLDVESMTLAAQQTFKDLQIERIEGGFHDLYLSPLPSRQHYLAAIDQWLASRL